MTHGGAWLDELPHALTLFRRDHEAAAFTRVDPLCPADFGGYRAGYRNQDYRDVCGNRGGNLPCGNQRPADWRYASGLKSSETIASSREQVAEARFLCVLPCVPRCAYFRSPAASYSSW